VLVGTDYGQVHQFFVGFSDNGNEIPYSARGPLFSADPAKTHSLDRFELYLAPMARPSSGVLPVGEIVHIEVDGYGAPLQPASPIVSLGSDISEYSWINEIIEPGPNNPNNIEANFLQVTVSSLKSLGGFKMSGGTLYVTFNDKGDYGNN